MLIKRKDSTKVVGVSRRLGNGIRMQNDVDKMENLS